MVPQRHGFGIVRRLCLWFGVPLSAQYESSGRALRRAALARRPQSDGRRHRGLYAPLRRRTQTLVLNPAGQLRQRLSRPVPRCQRELEGNASGAYDLRFLARPRAYAGPAWGGSRLGPIAASPQRAQPSVSDQGLQRLQHDSDCKRDLVSAAIVGAILREEVVI